MVTYTTAVTEIELLAADGVTWLPLSLVPSRSSNGSVSPRHQDATLESLVDGTPLGEKLYPVAWKNRGLGIGVDYNFAPGCYTRTPGIVTSAGAVTQAGLAGQITGSVVAIEQTGADLWMGWNPPSGGGGKVFRNPGGTGTGASAFTASLNTLAAGEYVRDLALFGDGTGARYLYASSSDINGLNGRLHRWNGTAWASTAPALFGTNGRNRMWRVWWRTRDGIGAYRLFTISGPNKVSYTVPNADPFLAASWVEGIEIDTAYSLLELGGSRNHVYMTATDNVYDIDQNGDSYGLMTYAQQMPQDGNGACIQYLNQYLYVAMARGMHRLYVGQPGALSETPAQCAPGWGTPAENELRGYPTAMCPDQGELVSSVYNPTTKRSYVCWSLPKTEWQGTGMTDSGPNPLLHYGPELLFDADYRVTRLRSTAISGDLRLWFGATSVGGGGLLVGWLSLPIAGAPLQDLVSGGSMRFCTDATSLGTIMQPWSRLELLKQGWDDDPSLKIVDEVDTAIRGLSKVRQADGSTVDDGIGTKVTYEQAADPAPGAVTWPVGTDITISPSQVLTPTAVQGSQVWTRFRFINPHGTTTPPKIGVLDACRIDAWRIAPAVVTFQLTVQYGDSVLNLRGGSSESGAPDTMTDELLRLVAGGRTTMRLANDKRYAVKVDQYLNRSEALTVVGARSPYGKQVTAELRIKVLDGPLL